MAFGSQLGFGPLGFAVAVEGLEDLDDYRDIGRNVERMASMALNRTTQKARTLASREMREQVAFKSRYLIGPDGKLTIDKKASPEDLETAISGRFRPTALTTFVTSVKRQGARNPTVMVAPGRRVKMGRAFMMRLRSSNTMTETVNNLGLAIRLAPGERLQNRVKSVEVSSGLYLLYGPSVDQVFRTVSEDISEEVAGMLEDEFFRLMGVNYGL